MAKKANNPQNLIPGANKNGRPKLTEVERMARESSRIEIAETWPAIKATPLEDLKRLVKDKTQPSIIVLMASAMIEAITTGNMNEIHRFYDRLLGKPTQPVDVDATLNQPIQVIINRVKPE